MERRLLLGIGFLVIALPLLGACAVGPTPQLGPAGDRPTFVWIFSDP